MFPFSRLKRLSTLNQVVARQTQQSPFWYVLDAAEYERHQYAMRGAVVFLVICVLTAAAMIGCGRTRSGAPEQNAETASQPSAQSGPLDYYVEWQSNDVPPRMSSDAPVQVHVSVRNAGKTVWPDPFTANPEHPDGAKAVRLSYRWVSSGGALLPQGSERADLRKPIAPGEVANFVISVKPPPETGAYQLQFDLVQELVTFFSAHGAEKLSVPVTIE